MKNKNKKKIIPLVSVCTPTFNRRPFIPYLFKCFMDQTYSKDRIEWIIVDDGTDCIKDIVDEQINKYQLSNVKYHYYNDRMKLGKKRNLMHSLCSGDIIVYMDDDDYYPPERIEHAVSTLENNKKYLIAGSSEMHIYFRNKDMIYQCGPYKENHSTAASFAFRKELLLETSYDDDASLAEETVFLKNYTIPLIQLDVLKTILVFAHCQNSFDKNILLDKPRNESKIIESKYVIDDFLKNNELKDFYIKQLDEKLALYEPGDPKHKPDVLNQIKQIQDNRAQRMWEYKKNMEIQQLKLYYENIIKDKNYLIQELFNKIKNTI
jgi:glycosyltransferase involved in cell wall biosynthesis